MRVYAGVDVKSTSRHAAVHTSCRCTIPKSGRCNYLNRRDDGPRLLNPVISAVARRQYAGVAPCCSSDLEPM